MKHPIKTFFLLILGAALMCMPVLMSTVWATEQGLAPAQPSVVQLDSIANQYGAVTFDHQMHTYIAKGCGDCHHSHPSASQSCRNCHDLDASVFKHSVVTAFRACKDCHGTYSVGTPSMPALKVAYHKKCFGCHVGIGDLGKSPKACIETCHARAQ